MKLSSTFSHQDWTIRYGLFDPNGDDNTSTDDRPTVVFVHGTPWSSDVFYPLAKALLARKRYRVLLYDLPGYGQSQELRALKEEGSRFAGETSVALQGEALTALLKHLQLDGKDGRRAPAVIAHDIAGAIALRAHLLHGYDFESLLLMDTNTVLPWGDGFYKQARSEPDTYVNMPPNIFEAVVRSVIKSACFNPKKLESGWEDILAKAWVSSGDNQAERQLSFVRQIAQANDADVKEMLDGDMYSKVRCDVKILWGENDQWIPRNKMEELVGMLKHRLQEFVVIPEAGHLVMIDQPERVAVEVFTWLAER